MKLATTTLDFVAHDLTHEECVKRIYDAGFRYIDFGVGRNFLEDNRWRDNAKRLRDYAESLGMKFIQMHSPEGNPLDLNERDKLVNITNRSIEVCEIMGIPQTVVHSGWKAYISEEEYFEGNLEFYRQLFPAMEKTGVNVLIENSSSKNFSPEKYYYFITGKQMVDFLKYADHPLLHAVWDTGHANTEGTQYEQIMALGKELYGLHIHDNSGRGDEHALPYFGTINMDDIMNALIDVDYQGYFTFEAVTALRNSNNRHGKRHVFERDCRLREPSLEMQIDLERLLYTIGKHCLTSYNLFEE